MSTSSGPVNARIVFAQIALFSYRLDVDAMYVDVGAGRLRGRAFH